VEVEGNGVTKGDRLERMRAIVAQAIAEAEYSRHAPLSEVHLVVYGDINDEQVRALFAEACQGTAAEGVRLVTKHAGSRYICWSCCGLRFESSDGMCPNCGELSLEVPEEIVFGLRQVKVDEAT